MTPMPPPPHGPSLLPSSPQTRRKPPWIKVRAAGGGRFDQVRAAVRTGGLHTVCEEARCPNRGDCWGSGTATFLILGDTCTRRCAFCAVRTGVPRDPGPGEPEEVACAVEAMGLDHAVITSVDRDDLEDLGAGLFGATVRAIRARTPAVGIEVLTPDFQGRPDAIRSVVDAGCDVYAHNLETVARLHPRVRDGRATYAQSLAVLAEARQCRPGLATKSGLMLGLGETADEVRQAMVDLLGVGVSILTLGQYLQPGPRHLEVAAFIPPEGFAAWRKEGEAMGFAVVAAGPLIRSSYRAGAFHARLHGSVDSEP